MVVQSAYRIFVGIMVVAAASSASMRVRYCYCLNHVSTEDVNCNKGKRSHEYREKIIPGIWDGYVDGKGFDDLAADNLGAFTSAPYVSASYYIDSVYDSDGALTRKNGPMVEGWASASDLRNPSYEMNLDGYIVYAAGHLNIARTGTYELQMNYNDGMVMWMDLNQDGTINLDNESINGTKDAFGWSWSSTKPFNKSVTFSKTGYTKILLFYWDWGEVGHAMLSWKEPGGTMKPIPAAAFGKRKNYGLPVAHITKIERDGQAVSLSEWSFMDVQGCKTFKLYASADNMLGATPSYIWNFGDGKTETTTSSSVSHIYKTDPNVFAYAPNVQVKRDTKISAPSGEVILIMINGCTTTPVLSSQKQPGRNQVMMSGTALTATGESTDHIVYSVVNMAGQESLRKAAKTINLAALPAGMYMVAVYRNGLKAATVPVMVSMK